MMSRDLRRSLEFRLTDNPDGDGLTLEGYAAVFDQDTRIDSWEGMFIENIRSGAFKRSIKSRTPVLQFEHGRHPLIGSLPIGSIEQLNEDDQGLFVRARLANNWLTEPVRDAIANESVNGMSFRFEIVREEWIDKQGKRLSDPAEIQRLLWEPGDRGPLTRSLLEVRLFELGPVVFPAYDGTSVGVRMAEAVRSADPDQIRTLRASLAAQAPVAANFTREEALALLTPELSPTHEVEERTNDDPLEEHSTTEVGPPDVEHSSPLTPAQRQQVARRHSMTLKGVGKRYA